MKKLLITIIFAACASVSFAQMRSFYDIFPNISQDIRTAALGESGYVKPSKKSSGFIIIGNENGSNLDPQIVNIILRKNPGYLVESIIVLPAQASLLDVYNALGNVRDLKGRLYSSYSKKQSIPLFEDATRIVSEKQTTAIPDPAPARNLPQTETVFLRLKDSNFGNSYYRAEMALVQKGLRYTLSNIKNLSYLFVPVIKEDKFIAQLYFEPVQEGILIYSIAGADISDFFASKININSAISKRLEVITGWAADGIIKKTP
ncbi:MAG: hypothetical protein FWB86_10735 [Treponema sp.]|nr:hypothetical protein [Treponema sp.]